MPPEVTRTEADAVAEIATKHHEIKTFSVSGSGDGIEVIAIPKGMEAKSIKPFLDEFRTQPERRKGIAVLQDLASFIEHANRFKDADSAIFASPDPTSPSLTSVLDYHRAGEIDTAAPRFGTHRGHYAFPLSEEWRAWTGRDGKSLSQTDFAEWIEARLVDVADPAQAGDTAARLARTLGCDFATPARLLELSRGLAIRVSSAVKNIVNLGTGEAQVQYITEHANDAGAPLKIPGAFLLALPVFRNGAGYKVPVRLRYRHRENAVTWSFHLHRPEVFFEDAFREACAKAKTDTALPLYVGSPEA